MEIDLVLHGDTDSYRVTVNVEHTYQKEIRNPPDLAQEGLDYIEWEVTDDHQTPHDVLETLTDEMVEEAYREVIEQHAQDWADDQDHYLRRLLR